MELLDCNEKVNLEAKANIFLINIKYKDIDHN